MATLLIFVVATVFIGKLILRRVGRTVVKVKVYPVAMPTPYPVQPNFTPPYPPQPQYPAPEYPEHYHYPVDQRHAAINEPLTEDEEFNEVVRDFYQQER
jgi:hypothetical protein